VREFIEKHSERICGVLSGLDRVRFRGTFRNLAVPVLLMKWLSHRNVLLKDFKPFVEGVTASLKGAIEGYAAAKGRTVQYLQSSAISKEDLAKELIRREGLTEGLVCVLSCVEPCRSYEIFRNSQTKTLDLNAAFRKCLHWYVYLLHPLLGLCHVRIQSWLPLTIHVCVNGREMLCRKLTDLGIGFERRDNCLARVDDVERAQSLLDEQPWLRWSDLLTGLVREVCPPLLELPYFQDHLQPYWSADETEYATDVMFRSSGVLAELYPSLLRHSMTTFGSRQVLRFLGRVRIPKDGVSSRFNGEITTRLTTRPEGVCVKHYLNRNSIKMYDKQGSVLRIETTINDTRDFRVFRTAEGEQPDAVKRWLRLRKGVVDLPRRCEVSQAANSRYLTAQASVDVATPLGEITDRLATPVISRGHRSRGLNPMSGIDAELVGILLKGEFCINGFRNRDLRDALFGPTADPAEHRRQSGRITRLLRLFVDHGLVCKVAKTHRYQLSAEGRRLLPSFATARAASTQKLAGLAA